MPRPIPAPIHGRVVTARPSAEAKTVSSKFITRDQRSNISAPVMDWLGRGQHSGTILATAQRLIQVQRVLRQALPGAMGRACQVAAIDADKMILLVPSAAHAAKLRQLAPAVLRNLSSQGWALTDIQIKIAMQAPQVSQPPPRPSAPLSEKGVQAFAQLAANLPPGPLADAVQRLLAHHRAIS